MLLDCCCGSCGQVCVTVLGCASVLLPGCLVTVTQGGTTIGTCTTNGSGVCCITIPSAGTYTIAAGPPVSPAGYASVSGSHVLTCTTNNVTLTLPAASGYSCSNPGACCTNPGPPYAAVTFPGTIFCNDGIGTVTCTGSPSAYNGTATRTSANGYNCAGGTHGSISVGVNFTVKCIGTGDWRVDIWWYTCKAGGSCITFSSCLVSVVDIGDPTCFTYNSNPSFVTTLGTQAACPPTALNVSGSITLVYGTGNCFFPGWTASEEIAFALGQIYGHSDNVMTGLSTVTIPITLTS